MPGRRSARTIAVVAALASLAAGHAQAAGIDWSTYGFDLARSGFDPAERTLSPGAMRSVREQWRLDLGGPITAQPLVASGVQLSPGRTADLVYAGTEAGRFAAVNAATGRVVWRRSFGSVRVDRCHDLPRYGITGTPVLDRANGSIYVVDGRGTLYELALATGAIKRRWSLTRRPTREHVWGGLALDRGVLYVTVAGICDLPTYRGRVVAFATESGERVATWYVAGRRPASGGIWGWGGVSIDPLADAVYAATGNAGWSGHDRYGERVVRLSRELRVQASNHPGLPRDDADFGATPLLYQAPACEPQLAVVNKYGFLYVYARDRIGQGPVQRIRLGGDVYADKALVGVPAYLPAERTLYVANPVRHGGFKAGVLAFSVTRRCRLRFRWQAPGPSGVSSSPTVADGVVYYGDGVGGQVIALDARSGHRLWTSGRTLQGRPVFSAPTVIGGRIFVGGWDGLLYAFGRPEPDRDASRPGGHRSRQRTLR